MQNKVSRVFWKRKKILYMFKLYPITIFVLSFWFVCSVRRVLNWLLIISIFYIIFHQYFPSSPSEVRRNKTFSHFDLIPSSFSQKKTIKIEHPHFKEDNTTVVPNELIFNKQNNNNINININNNNNNNKCGIFTNQNGSFRSSSISDDNKDCRTIKHQNGNLKISKPSSRKPSRTSRSADVSIDSIGEEDIDSQYTVWI